MTNAQRNLKLIGHQRKIYLYRTLIEECYQEKMVQFKIINHNISHTTEALPPLQIPYDANSSKAFYQSLVHALAAHNRQSCGELIQVITQSNRQYNDSSKAALPVVEGLNKYLVVSTITILTQATIYASFDPQQVYQLSDDYLNALATSDMPVIDFIGNFLDNLLDIPTVAARNEINLFKHLVQKNIYNKISVNFIAAEMKTSPVQLRRLVKRELATTPLEYINNQKIAMSRYLLISEPTMPILEIAEILGFYDSSHFVRDFTVHNGLTPKEYRQVMLAKASIN